MPSQIKLFKIISLLCTSTSPLLLHTHAQHTYHSTIFIVQPPLPSSPRSNKRDTICTLTSLFPCTHNTLPFSTIFISQIQKKKDTFFHFSLSFPSLSYNTYNTFLVQRSSSFTFHRFLVGIIQVMGKDGKCRSPRIERKGEVRCWCRCTHSSSRLLGPRRKLGRSFLRIAGSNLSHGVS